MIRLSSPEECARRDVKGMWAKAKTGEIKEFTGYSAPYEEPEFNEITVYTEKETIDQSSEKIIKYLKQRKLI